MQSLDNNNNECATQITTSQTSSVDEIKSIREIIDGKW